MGCQPMAGHCTFTYTQSFTPRGNLSWPFHLLAHFVEVGGNQITHKDMMRTCTQTLIQAQNQSGDSKGMRRNKGTGRSVVKDLSNWLEGCGLKSQHFQADTVGSLGKSLKGAYTQEDTSSDVATRPWNVNEIWWPGAVIGEIIIGNVKDAEWN